LQTRLLVPTSGPVSGDEVQESLILCETVSCPDLGPKDLDLFNSSPESLGT